MFTPEFYSAIFFNRYGNTGMSGANRDVTAESAD